LKSASSTGLLQELDPLTGDPVGVTTVFSSAAFSAPDAGIEPWPGSSMNELIGVNAFGVSLGMSTSLVPGSFVTDPTRLRNTVDMTSM
jgi:hypothetical protein